MKETKENLDLNIPQEVRLAFLISKKIDKKAHNRNRLKRQLSEMAGLFLKQYNGFKKSFDIVILPLSGIHSKTFQDLDRDLNNLLSQITSHKYYEKTNY
ncbi:ribonuclease P protein component [Candidatus Peregrinibacteria bacterium RIFOXYA2_FULL_33_21]|nr:MAG: ribonuclease P protein component [Candidatus Peregrinibacteria bacterium RIFOXYA2_FULL_33_21]